MHYKSENTCCCASWQWTTLGWYYSVALEAAPLIQWASCQIRKIADAHAPGMPGTFSPSPQVSDPDMHHGTCVTHVPWCMPGSLYSSFLWNRRRGKTFPAFPAHAQPVFLRIWQEAHGVKPAPSVSLSNTSTPYVLTTVLIDWLIGLIAIYDKLQTCWYITAGDFRSYNWCNCQFVHLPWTKWPSFRRRHIQTHFPWMKKFEFWLKFHWSLFPRVQLTITQHLFRSWLGTK